MITSEVLPVFPKPLTEYAAQSGAPLLEILTARVREEPFNAVATGIFLLAILHTFAATRFTTLAHRLQRRQDDMRRRAGRPPAPSVRAELVHFLGEIEVVFGLWAVLLMVAVTAHVGWASARHYISETVNYTEPLFVVVIMTLAATRPIVRFAEAALRRVARAGGATPAAWWITILICGPILGSLITEPAAMTIAALLLGRQFYDLQPSVRLKYATLGLLFVNVSIGGTLTHFAAPPVLMVARSWQWDTPFMIGHFGWRAALAIVASTITYFFWFKKELRSLSRHPPVADIEHPDEEALDAQLLPVPTWLTAAHVLFMAWTVVNAHYPALFVGGFLFFLGLARATAAFQSQLEFRTPMLVGFFLAGLVIHGGLQAWWIGPVLRSLPRDPLFLGSTLLTAFNDNAMITYLGTLVPHLDDQLKIALVEGAVTGGGLTVIANAPNPAGQALLSRFFDNAISPVGLALGALVPTLIAASVFRGL
jgi:hypothetical protein